MKKVMIVGQLGERQIGQAETVALVAIFSPSGGKPIKEVIRIK